MRVPLWKYSRPRRVSRKEFYQELDRMVDAIEGDQLAVGARLYAENNGTLSVIGTCQESSNGSLLTSWTKRFVVPGCPHCIIVEWDEQKYPEKAVGRDRYLHQVLSGSRPSIEVALGGAADRFPEVMVPVLSGRVRGSCDSHVPVD